MRGNLFRKVFAKMFVFCAVNIGVFLVFDTQFGLGTEAGVLLLVINTVFLLFVTNSVVIKPIKSLVEVILPIDFNLDVVDFTKLDNFEYKSEDEIKVLTDKFKELSDVLVVRVDKVNSETYKSEHDGLSGLYNRVKYQRMKGVYTGCNSVCVLYIDVNNLKKMNDIFGHRAGDALIKSSAKKLKFWDGIGDCYRMGGDEFMVVITNKSEYECMDLINTWYPTVGVLNRDSDGFKCMMAYGVAFGGMYSDTDELIKEADEKMYQHKIEIKKANGEDPNSR